MSKFNFDGLVQKKCVLANVCALARNSLTTIEANKLGIWTKLKELDGIDFGAVTYYYKKGFDTEHYLAPAKTNPLILIPTPERAIVEYIQNEKWCDEGTLIEALKSYLFRYGNTEKLFEVARFFGLSEEHLSYWITEAEEDEEI